MCLSKISEIPFSEFNPRFAHCTAPDIDTCLNFDETKTKADKSPRTPIPPVGGQMYNVVGNDRYLFDCDRPRLGTLTRRG